MKPETNLERIQREVFSCDTEAGYKLRHHITRALVCDGYAKEIDFNRSYNNYDDLTSEMPTVADLFIFDQICEGKNYWWNICSMEIRRRK